MRAVLLAVLLSALPAHASYLEIHTYCGKPTYYLGVVDGKVEGRTPTEIALNSSLVKFFERVLRGLPLVNGKPEYYVVAQDKLLGLSCPVPV